MLSATPNRLFIAERSQQELSKLDLRTFRLYRDLPAIRGGVETVVHQIAIDPDFDRTAYGFYHHVVPLTERLLGIVSQVLDASFLALSDPPICAWPSTALHVGNLDVFDDAPEIAGVAAFHLNLDGFGKHPVERARRGRVHENTRVARRSREAIFELEPVVAITGIRDEMSARLTQAHEDPVAHDERTAKSDVGVGRGNVDVPAGEISAVEEILWLALRSAALGRGRDRHHAEREDQK